MKTIVKIIDFKTLTIVVIFLNVLSEQIPDPNKMKNYKYIEGLNLESWDTRNCFGWVGIEVANRSQFNKCGGK
jgi:hypothetical protein